VLQEALAKAGDGLLDATAQIIERAGALLLGALRPTLEERLARPLSGQGLKPRLVANEPEEDEVGVDLALKHRLQVELDVGLARQGGVVAQDAEAQPVRDHAPSGVLRAVEVFLDEAMRTRARGARDPGRAPVEVQPAAYQVERDGLPGVRDGVGFAVDLGCPRGGEAAKAQLLEERLEPALAGEPGAGITGV